MKMSIFRLRNVAALASALGSLSVALPAAAQVYQCANGTYTNKRSPGCSAANLGKIGSYTSIMPKTPVAVAAAPVAAAPRAQKAAYRAPAPAAYPVSADSAYQVSAGTQRNRDQGRRQILENELAQEKAALAQAQRDLADSRALATADRQQRISRLQGAVTDRQENIAAIQKELSRM